MITGCIYLTEEPIQTFCECGKAIKLYIAKWQLPIRWIKKGCDECSKKIVIWKKSKRFLEDINEGSVEEMI